MVYRFLEKEESPKPTIAMDYSFGRKAGKSLVRNSPMLRTMRTKFMITRIRVHRTRWIESFHAAGADCT